MFPLCEYLHKNSNPFIKLLNIFLNILIFTVLWLKLVHSILTLLLEILELAFLSTIEISWNGIIILLHLFYCDKSKIFWWLFFFVRFHLIEFNIIENWLIIVLSIRIITAIEFILIIISFLILRVIWFLSYLFFIKFMLSFGILRWINIVWFFIRHVRVKISFLTALVTIIILIYLF